MRSGAHYSPISPKNPHRSGGLASRYEPRYETGGKKLRSSVMTHHVPPVYIVSAVRTPIGAYLGGLTSLPAPRLGAIAIKSAIERAKLQPNQVQEVFMGNVLSAGIGQAPARQAAIYAGVPDTVPATTVSKVCGSGLQAVIFGTKTLQLGDADLVVTGGMESMS